MGGRVWTDVAADFPTYCYDTFSLLTEDAMRYYLPAYMLSALGPNDGLQGTSVEYELDGRLPASSFTVEQRDAIVAWADKRSHGAANGMGPEWFREDPLG